MPLYSRTGALPILRSMPVQSPEECMIFYSYSSETGSRGPAGFLRVGAELRPVGAGRGGLGTGDLVEHGTLRRGTGHIDVAVLVDGGAGPGVVEFNR